MKIRISITAPILPEGVSDRGAVALPAMLARNFDAGDPASVWIESKAALARAAAPRPKRATAAGK